MATTTSPGIDSGILLEAGTNEVEILVFRVGDERFGVNVAKVREVLEFEEFTALPESHVSVDGMVRIRDQVVMLVNLKAFLSGTERKTEQSSKNLMLLLEFNEQLLAFRVEAVEKIFRISWNQTKPLPSLMGVKAPVTSVVLLDGHLLPMLDFETIAAVIGIHAGPPHEEEIATPKNDFQKLPIVIAEDSRMISQMVQDALHNAGYINVKAFSDGHEAWSYLSGIAEETTQEQLPEKAAILISDIEMPRVDGLNLTKRIRENPVLSKMPVILFSSLVSRDNVKKGMQVGANAQISKPRYDELVSELEPLIQSLVC